MRKSQRKHGSAAMRRLCLPLLLGIISGTPMPADGHNYKGKVVITNHCSEEALPALVVIDIEIATPNGTIGAHTDSAPNQEFTIPNGADNAQSWRITKVARKDGTPVCSCICCKQPKDAIEKNNIQKCQQKVEAVTQPADVGKPDNREAQIFQMSCNCDKRPRD